MIENQGVCHAMKSWLLERGDKQKLKYEHAVRIRQSERLKETINQVVECYSSDEIEEDDDIISEVIEYDKKIDNKLILNQEAVSNESPSYFDEKYSDQWYVRKSETNKF